MHTTWKQTVTAIWHEIHRCADKHN